MSVVDNLSLTSITKDSDMMSETVDSNTSYDSVNEHLTPTHVSKVDESAESLSTISTPDISATMGDAMEDYKNMLGGDVSEHTESDKSVNEQFQKKIILYVDKIKKIKNDSNLKDKFIKELEKLLDHDICKSNSKIKENVEQIKENVEQIKENKKYMFRKKSDDDSESGTEFNKPKKSDDDSETGTELNKKKNSYPLSDIFVGVGGRNPFDGSAVMKGVSTGNDLMVYNNDVYNSFNYLTSTLKAIRPDVTNQEVRERSTQYLNDCNDFLKSFDPSVLLTAGVSTILLMATQTDTFYNTPSNIRSRRVLDAKITDGATDRQTSKLTASARQIVGHLQGFVNDIDAGVYSQRTLYPLPSAVRSYSKLLDPTVLNKRYQDARTGIKTVNKTVNKLENGRKMHAKEVDGCII